MTLGDAITKFYHDMGIMELRRRNQDPALGKLTYNSCLYLDIIAAHQGEYTPSKLADLLRIARPSVTQKLNQLEKLGYITKKQNPKDRREYFLYFNESAFSEAETAYLRVERRLNEMIPKHYTKEDIERFSEILSFIEEICIDTV